MKTSNSYTLTKKLQRVRRIMHLSAMSQALYHKLISIYNEEKWVKIFAVKNEDLHSGLHLTEKTLIKLRKELIDAGLIFYRSTRNKQLGCLYSFTEELSTGNIPDDQGLSTGNTPDDSPCIYIINKESNTPTLENSNLTYPFHSDRFNQTWEILRNQPKWKKKSGYALQLSLNKLGVFDEEFAIMQMERAIESNWTGVVFPQTKKHYEDWKNEQNLNTNNGKEPETLIW